MFADWQLSMRVKRDPQTLNLLHRSDWRASLSSSTVISPDLDLSWCWTESVCRPERTASSKPGNTGTSQRSVLSAVDMLSSLLLLCYFHIWTLHAECSDQSGATLIADGSGAGSSERDTTCVCRCSEFLHIKLEKCFFVHVFISAECVNFTLLCAGTNTDRCVCLSVTVECCGACSPQTVTVSKTITEVIEKQCSLEMFPLIKPSTDSFTRTCSGPTRGLWPYVWHHTLDAFMTPEPWNKWLKTEHFIYLINLLT